MSGTPSELKSKMVRAGAGAGKTTGLVAQVLNVFEIYKTKTQRAPRIVVTTFTRKATQELKERLIRKACDDRNASFLRFVSDPSHLHISTIHGLMSVFLKQTGHLADLDAGFQLLSEAEAYSLARRALRETLLLHPSGLSWFETYEFERVLSMCRAYDEAVREQGVLTPATQEDLKAVAGPLFEQWRSRLKEFAATVLEEVEEPGWVGFAQTLMSFADAWPETPASARPKKPAKRGKDQKALEPWHDRAEEMFKEFDKLFDREAWDPNHWPKMEGAWQEFQSFADDFSKQLMRMKELQGRYEMSDLELLTHRILEDRPFLGEVFSENWDYWMVDEFQDTSPIQAKCLERLIREKPRYLVGDPQQSIYLFRGADVTVFTETERELKALGSEVEERMTNYRSSPALLNFINEFMESVSDRFKAMKTGLSSGDARHVAEFVRAPDPEAEMEALVNRVGELLKGGADLQEICILGRTHGHLFDAAVALRKYGYPTHLHASSGFNERREVRDAQAIWTFLFNPHDTENLVALLRSPWFFVADEVIGQWLSSRPSSLWKVIASDPRVETLKKAQESLREIGAVRTFEKLLIETGALDLCLQYDPAGRKESNLWKLIDKARKLESEGTRSMLELSESELTFDPLESSEGDATSAQEPNCINLMTVHAAKGLEFDHVIVPRMGHGLPPRKAKDFSSNDGKYFFPLRDGEGERIPSLLDMKIMERDAELENAEFNRALYVAVTRAKKTLTFTWSRLDKDAWAARSEWFQRPVGLHEQSGYSFQVRDEWAAPLLYVGRSQADREIRPPWTSASVEAPNHESVTAKISITPKDSSASAKMLRRLESRRKGQLIHKRLEAMRYGHEVDTDDPALKFVLELKSPPMAELIQGGLAEWGFQVKTKTGVLEGQIDLWGKADGQLYVIDYKSGSMDALEQAFQQLEYYGAALRKFGHQEPITLAVIYPNARKVETRAFDEDKLTEIL